MFAANILFKTFNISVLKLDLVLDYLHFFALRG